MEQGNIDIFCHLVLYALHVNLSCWTTWAYVTTFQIVVVVSIFFLNQNLAKTAL